MQKALSILFISLLTVHCYIDFYDTYEKESIYEPDIVEDEHHIDYLINSAWRKMFDTIYAGFGFLKDQVEDELKKAVTWVEDYKTETENKYEKALKDFETTYLQNCNQECDYQFVYYIEQIVYEELADLDKWIIDSKQQLETEYWAVLKKLDDQADECENLMKLGEIRIDDVMDVTEKDVESYVEKLNDNKWIVEESEYSTAYDIDADIDSYADDDEDEINYAETAALSQLYKDLSGLDWKS